MYMSNQPYDFAILIMDNITIVGVEVAIVKTSLLLVF